MRAAVKPPALKTGETIAIVVPASPADEARLNRGARELERLGYKALYSTNALARDGYFAAPLDLRRAEFLSALAIGDYRAVFCARGGYGSGYLLEDLDPQLLRFPKIVLGYSDITALEIYLWQQFGWVTFYGPMVATGFDAGPDVPGGYDSATLKRALTEAQRGWCYSLEGEPLARGEAAGVLLGGCLTLVETTLGTPWELDTDGAILLLEDRGMKPYQVDRALLHLKQAGKLTGVRGVILGEFPECEPPVEGDPTVREVCGRILGELGVPVIWGAAIGHTPRAMLTVPLGVRARLRASGSGQLEILEPAVVA